MGMRLAVDMETLGLFPSPEAAVGAVSSTILKRDWEDALDDRR